MEVTYHIEALVRKLSGLVSRCTVYTRALLVLLGRPQDSGYSLLQFLVHCTIKNGMSDVVSKIIRSNEEDINTGNFCNGINLSHVNLKL